MAFKRSTPLDDPPSASSDDEETEDDEPEEEEEEVEDEFDSESEEEEQSKSKPQNPIETPKIPNPNSKPSKSSSSSSEEEEQESDSESEEQKPIDASSKTLTPKSSTVFDFDTDPDVKSPTASGFAIKPSKKVEKTPTSKRLFQGSDLKEKNNKKKKMKVSNGDFGDDEKKSSVVKRVWSDDDELLLLQGFIEYQSKKGCSPLSDMEGFYHFTMDSLPGNASKSQLYEKIRRLKKKFRVNSEKTSENGEDPVFQKPHERKLFEVSKKIWGVDGCETLGALNASNVKSSRTKTKPKVEAKEELVEEEEEDDYEEEDVKVVAKVEDFETLYPFLSAGLKIDVSSSLNFPSGVVHLVKEKLSLIGEAKVKELNGKWKAYFENETMLRKRRIALLSNVAALG